MTSTKVIDSARSELVKIVSHPLRVRCLIAMRERETSVSKLAKDLNVDKGTLYAHVKKLEDSGAIEEVRTESVRGATEHFYKAVQRPLTTDEEYASMTPSQRLEWSSVIIQMIIADVAYALEEGSFIERPDHNAIRFPCNLDEQGWADVTEVYEKAFERALEIEAESAGRMIESGEDSKPVRVMSMVFEFPS